MPFQRFALILLTATVADAQEPAAKPGIPLRLTVETRLEREAEGRKAEPTRTLEVFDYRLDRKGQLVASSLDAKASLNEMGGIEVIRIDEDPDGRMSLLEGVRDIPPNREEYFAQYEEPLLVVTVDDEGREIRREEKSGRGILSWRERMNFTRVFHPKFAKDAAEWDAPAAFPLFDLGAGESGSVKGTLHYKKRARAAEPAGSPADDLVPVDVVGTLQVSGHIGLHMLTNALFIVEGTQHYSPRLREWVKGKQEVKLKYSLEFGGSKAGSCSGTWTYILGARTDTPRLPPAKK